mmetsp:Transcript_382/g.938  ORF Transcript_382/g.938 Transcript_382/m.938 type:complete len:128 (+) Transcript_382:1-384(+)
MMAGEDADFLETSVDQPTAKAGDVIIFSEATIHGCLPWTAEHQRRVALFRFAPAHLGFARGYSDPAWPPSFTDGMTPEQRAVMEPPYHPMYDRPYLRDEDGKLGEENRGRSDAKKAFDVEVFGHRYY